MWDRFPPAALTLALVPSCGEILLTLPEETLCTGSSYQDHLQLFLVLTAESKAASYSRCNKGVLRGRPAPTNCWSEALYLSDDLMFEPLGHPHAAGGWGQVYC